jgi:hypothetical protein
MPLRRCAVTVLVDLVRFDKAFDAVVIRIRPDLQRQSPPYILLVGAMGTHVAPVKRHSHAGPWYKAMGVILGHADVAVVLKSANT